MHRLDYDTAKKIFKEYGQKLILTCVAKCTLAFAGL